MHKLYQGEPIHPSMTHTIKIDISKCTYLADYCAAKYGSGTLSFPKNHLVHRRMQMLLKSEDRFIKSYRSDFLEIELQVYRRIDTRRFNKLSSVGEAEIIATLKNEMWADFDAYALECECLEKKTVIYSFMEDHNLSEDTYDMLRKHLTRLPEKTKKIRSKIATSRG